MAPDNSTTPRGWPDQLHGSAVAGRLPTVSFAPGEPVFREDEIGEFFLIVVEGEAEVFRHGNLVATVGAGSVLGELALLTGSPRSMTVIARSPMRALRGNAEDFAELLDDDAIREHFTHLAAARLAANVEPVPFAAKDGFLGELRPLLPGDRPAYIDLLTKLSPESRRRRFFTATLPSDRLIDYLLDIDFVNHFAWVALDRSTVPHQGCGIARFIRSHDDVHSAEVAFAVIDAYQGRGIGSTLLGALAVAADAAAITVFTAEVLDDNTPMRQIFERADAKWTRPDRGVLAATVSVAHIRSTLDPALDRALTESTAGLGLASSTALNL